MQLDKNLKNKPCKECPWIQKGVPLATDQVKEACKNGKWFCCHVNLGTCHGAVNYRKILNK